MKKKIILLLLLAFLLIGCGKSNVISLKNGKTVKITPSETKSIQFENFNNGLISLTIPKGWKVDIPSTIDYIHYTFKVYNPSNPEYMFFFGMKLEGYMKSERALNWQKKYYPNEIFAKLPAISPQTTEAFYKIWNQSADYSNKNEVKYSYFKHINNFEVIEDLGKDELGGSILRAKFTTDAGTLSQGLFTASVKSAGTYYVSENIWNIYSSQIDVWPLMVYNIIYMATPDDDFVNWQPILEKCLNTLEFSETFVNGFNKEEQSVMATFKANQKVYDAMSDMIMDSWEKRNNSYDIMSQKQSDATLGYERVYDTETGEIYKAYNGFTDDYSGERYKTITDDMYTKSIAGYIEK